MAPKSDLFLGTVTFESANSKKSDRVSAVLGGPRPLDDVSKIALGRVIPFLDKYKVPKEYEKTWRVVHSAELLKTMKPAVAMKNFADKVIWFKDWDVTTETEMYDTVTNMKKMEEWKGGSQSLKV